MVFKDVDTQRAIAICHKLYPEREAVIDCIVTDDDYVGIIFGDILLVIAASLVDCLYGSSDGFNAFLKKHGYSLDDDEHIPLPVPYCYVVGGEESELDLGGILIKATILPEDWDA